VRYTSPASGTVSAVNRGARRVLQSVVIDVEGDEKEAFAKYNVDEIASVDRDKVVENLVQSGVWTALRTRPYSKVPEIDAVPASIFVTAMDTNPLAADPAVVIAAERDAFSNGLIIISKLTEGNVFVCKNEKADFTAPNLPKIKIEGFGGVHPAGNAGTHIHFLDPVSVNKTVWTIGYQDVIAIGHLFLTGELYTQRVVSLAGPRVNSPRLLRTRLAQI
jgi:Na+-transporting NADH:ubiquinone oxidoreductase subunit A